MRNRLGFTGWMVALATAVVVAVVGSSGSYSNAKAVFLAA